MKYANRDSLSASVGIPPEIGQVSTNRHDTASLHDAEEK